MLAQQPDASMMSSNIQPATEKDLQSESQSEDNKLQVKSSKEEILEDLIKTQLELFMKTSDDNTKGNFLQKLNLSLVDVDNLDKIYDEYIQVNVINDMLLKRLIMNLFIDKNEYLENLDILYKYIKKDGMILFDIFSVDKLREDNILFNVSDSRDDEKLSLYIKSLNESEKPNALSFLLLRMGDNPQEDDSGKCLSNPEIENLLFIMDDNSDILNNTLEYLFSLLTESNKDTILKRIATIYNSVSEEKRKTLNRVDIMYHGVSVDKSVFDIPDYSIKVNKNKPKTLKKSSKNRNPICIQKENELMKKIRSREPFAIDSTTLNSLERCAIRSDESNPPELKLSDENNLDESNPPESTSDSTAPVVSHPDSIEPVVSHPDSTEPVVSQSDSIAPVLSQSDSIAPVLSQSDSIAPVVSQPDSTAPVVSHPDLTAPVVSQPDSTAPVVSTPVAPLPVTAPALPVTAPEAEPAAPVFSTALPTTLPTGLSSQNDISNIQPTPPISQNENIVLSNQNLPAPLNLFQEPGRDETGLEKPLTIM